jgi:multidrug efflux pump subunit AcrA (membrane-fusion protein)
VQAGEYVAEGQPVLEIIDDGELEFETLIPSEALTWLRVGTPFSVTLHEVEGPVEARVTRIAPLIDPVSQTIKIYARGASEGSRLMAGMSGLATFRQPAAQR